MFTPASSHLQVVLLLLQSFEATVVWLTLDSHVRLLLQDVQAQLFAAAEALLHVHRQAGVLTRRKVIMSIRRMSLNCYAALCIVFFPTRAKLSFLNGVMESLPDACVCVCVLFGQ